MIISEDISILYHVLMAELKLVVCICHTLFNSFIIHSNVLLSPV